MKIAKFAFPLFLILAAAMSAFAQAPAKYSYRAQKSFIPGDLGEVYIGMPFRDFVKKVDITDAAADTRFDFLSLRIPFERGSVTGLSVRVHGLTREELKAMTREVEITEGEGLRKYTRKEERIDPAKITGEGFVYAYYIAFEQDFDLKSWVLKAFGEGGEVHDPSDQYHFYDIQWTKETGDGLTWLIRSFHEGESRNLQLLGRISGTEWAVD